MQTVTIRCENGDLWQGFARVNILENEQTLTFHEKGEWEGQNISFTNTLRWTFGSDEISLEHHRFGFQSPIHLVHFTPTTPNYLHSTNPHLCGQDRYSARVFWNQEGIHLVWTIQSPLKNEKIHSHYR